MAILLQGYKRKPIDTLVKKNPHFVMQWFIHDFQRDLFNFKVPHYIKPLYLITLLVKSWTPIMKITLLNSANFMC